MKPQNNYSRPMAAFYLILGFLATLILLEIISFLTFYPLLKSQCARVLANLAWLYAGAFAYYKLTRRYTRWWEKLHHPAHLSDKE